LSTHYDVINKYDQFSIKYSQACEIYDKCLQPVRSHLTAQNGGLLPQCHFIPPFPALTASMLQHVISYSMLTSLSWSPISSSYPLFL